MLYLISSKVVSCVTSSSQLLKFYPFTSIMAQEILKGYHNKESKAAPAIDGSKLTIFGSRFCPFVRRVLLILDIKNISHDFIGIDLKSKPDWYLEMYPAGKVPYLKHGDKTLWESLVIVNYLDDSNPPTIHPTDPYIKARGSLLLDELFGLAITPVKCWKNAEMPNDKKISEISNDLAKLESIVGQIKTKYLQDDKPLFVDYMIAPFLEMIAPILEVISNDQSLNGEEFITKNYPSLGKYIESMNKDASFKKVSIPKNVQAEYFKMFAA